MPKEEKVKNPDLLIIILMRYFLEVASDMSLKKVLEGDQCEEFCELMSSAASGKITDEQLEYVLMFYAMRPEELVEDLEKMINTIRYMVDKALKGQ